VNGDLHHTVALTRKVNGTVVFEPSAPATDGIVKADDGGIFNPTCRKQVFHYAS
jgi:hypothetical protein